MGQRSVTNPARPTGRMTTAKWVSLLVFCVSSTFVATAAVMQSSITTCEERAAEGREALREANAKIAAQVETLQALLFRGAPFIE